MAEHARQGVSIYPESRVLIVATGGTIMMKEQENRGLVPARGFLEAGMAPRPSFNDGSPRKVIHAVEDEHTAKSLPSLRTPISRYAKHIRYAVLEFESLLDSSSINADGWLQIARTIYWNYELFDGFIVLHGTDSMAYTCSALSFMLQNLGKPVILTGSQAPILQLQNDATDNLLGSLIIAGHFMIPEVCLFFNYKLFRGNRVTKVSASDFTAFDSPNFPPLATVTSLKTKVSWELVYRSTDLEPFNYRQIDIGHVASLRIFPGIRPEMVDAVLRVRGVKGLVLETFGAGNAPGGPDGALTRIFSDAVRRGIVIVNVSQCLTGTVSPLYEPAMLLKQAGVVPGHDLTSEAALAKLPYLLALPHLNPEDVILQMSESLRGELTEQTEMAFEHPLGHLSNHVTNLTALGYAISRENIEQVNELLKGHPEWLLSEGDYTGNTPLHIAATSSSIAILRALLLKGASVHLRNSTGSTPLFLAANAGLKEHVSLLRQSGAHLHADELETARLHSQQDPSIWHAAGVSPTPLDP